MQDTGNKISRRALLEGKQNIMLGGKTVVMAGVTLRGDLHRMQEPTADGDQQSKGPVTAINIGRFVPPLSCAFYDFVLI